MKEPPRPSSSGKRWRICGLGRKFKSHTMQSEARGESGAGKTETAKIAMQYLAALGGGSGIEDEILKTNPILEAFGNAKTLRNDNSSRFGKLIEIHFSETGKISGANIQTFLLEKSRVVQCSEGERSYHIFYQLCAGAPGALKEKLNLKDVSEYNYLRQSNCHSISGVDDAEQFRIVMEALDVVHISKEDQESVFSMLAAVLWLGNISFTAVDNDNHAEPVVDEGLTTASTLIGCGVEELKLALSTRKMRVRNDDIVQKLTLSQATDTRDALAKSIYSCLFDWLVEQINKSLAVGKRRTGRSISILDIYGFESFERNSFEQFCINYANERFSIFSTCNLDATDEIAVGRKVGGGGIGVLYPASCGWIRKRNAMSPEVKVVGRGSRAEYIQDGIDWTKVDFDDNQDCLNLFEKKPLGLLSLLDEESTFPNGTDMSFANKLKQHLNSNLCFRGERGKAFTVSHYAGEVTYDTTGFLEKNRDLLHSNSIQLLSSCKYHLPQTFASNMLSQSEKPVVGPLYKSGGADSQKLSVSTKFKGPPYDKFKQKLQEGKEKKKDGPVFGLGTSMLEVSSSKPLASSSKGFAFWAKLVAPGLPSVDYLSYVGQLFQLMQRLENTTPHFIRCIKPNNFQSPGKYEQGLVLQQLRCCGVLEVVRISRSGFPTRMSHQKFARRYGFLLLDHVASQDPLSVSVAILHQFNILPDMYQVGFTKLFFRTGQKEFEDHEIWEVSNVVLVTKLLVLMVLPLPSIPVVGRTRSSVPDILCKLCKLDIQKTYDHLNWKFLLETLSKRCFGGFFSSQRGLRQGDPLTPFLFIIAMEGLNDMLLTHNMQMALVFCDVCDANRNQLKILRVIFVLFEAISGLHINWNKSFLYTVNEVPDLPSQARILGGRIEDLPTTYLGMPLGAKSKSIGI
ncbi:hypothetical protein MTR67_007065 [Solanum verrucosum]|uniref:Myosin motor domain-containing protein n=1 Tax=Solanum verrucosum TaxID=315347 RepID=A0AAF0Q2M0_SOLVR|nr:hypothetical protein MTR67_007065 [Solanum verrucosum]